MNNFLIPLTQFTEEVGATRVIPGSHRWDDLEAVGSPEDTLPAVMNPGDALFISGNVVHGGGANKTENFWRRAIAFSFVSNCLTPEEAMPLLTSKDLARSLSKRGQQMIGYRSQPLANGGSSWLADMRELADTILVEN